MERGQRGLPGKGTLDSTPAEDEEKVAGKATLISPLAGDEPAIPRLQLKDIPAAGRPGRTHAIAANAAAGASSPLPHLDAIQRSFGRHDVSGAKSVIDPGAADAMGAEGAAVDGRAVFGGAPSLHTAAHEAAHIVQQKAGVQLKGGVGAPGDAYERHADAVADRVVAGQSAEDLLDRPPGGGGASGPAVQLTRVKPTGDGGRAVRVESLDLEPLKQLIQQLKGVLDLDEFEIKLEGETEQQLLARAEALYEERLKTSETKSKFGVKGRAVNANGLVISDDKDLLDIAENYDFHVASASNRAFAFKTFGKSISKSAGGLSTDPDAWKPLFRTTAGGVTTEVFGKPNIDIRGERKDAAAPKANPKPLPRPPKDTWVSQIELKRPCTRGNESTSRDAAMSGYTAVNYAVAAGFPQAANHTWEWLHLVAASIGGNNEEGNLVAGTYDSNTDMINFERQVVDYCKQATVSPMSPAVYTVTARLLNKTWVADTISMTFEHGGREIARYDRTSALQISAMTKVAYDMQASLFERMFKGSQ